MTTATAQELPVGSTARLLDVQAVAAMLDCSPRHVYRFADSGKMPKPVKLGALVRWNRQTLEEWLAAGCPSVRTPTGRRARA